MTKPFATSCSISKMLDIIAKKKFGRSRTEAIAMDICVDCGKPAKNLKTELYRREYSINGLCAACQDKVINLNQRGGRKNGS